MMLRKLRVLRELWRIYRAREYFGDGVILKASLKPLLPTPAAAARLAGLRKVAPDFSDLDFGAMPAGSFGAAYAQFMKDFGLRPFRFSGRFGDLLEQNYLAVLYACVHDFFHVLAGFDTSLAGEAGVWAFAAAQDFTPAARTAVRMTRLLYPLVQPLRRRQILAASDQGLAAGREAQPLLFQDFRALFPRPLEEVRASLGVRPASVAAWRAEAADAGPRARA